MYSYPTDALSSGVQDTIVNVLWATGTQSVRGDGTKILGGRKMIGLNGGGKGSGALFPTYAVRSSMSARRSPVDTGQSVWSAYGIPNAEKFSLLQLYIV